VPEGSRVCPFCGARLHGSSTAVLPVIGRVATTISVVALGAALIWWILPLGLATGNGTPVQMSLAVSSPVVTATISPAPEGKAFVEELTTAAEMAEPAVSVTPLASMLAPNEGVSETATAPATLGVTEEATSVPAETSGPLTHTVAQGEVLGTIASRYGVPLEAVLQANGLSDNAILNIGDTLVIPTVPAESGAEPLAAGGPVEPAATAAPNTGPLVHVVAAGDTLGGLAVRYQVDAEQIAAENDISMNAVLSIGQELIIPGAALSPTGVPTVSVSTPVPTPSPTWTLPLPIASPTARLVATSLPGARQGTAGGRGIATTAGLVPSPSATAAPTATPTATPTALPTPAPTVRVHTVQSGEHIGILADLYGLTMQQIADANGISVSSILHVGQQLVIPGPQGAPAEASAELPVAEAGAATAVVAPTATPEQQVHVVQQGDTLGGIAVRYQVDSEEVARVNGISLNAVLSIGQELLIPGVTPEPTIQPTEAAPAPTATGLASATATPFPYRTRTIAMPYRQPHLLAPVNGAVLIGEASQPVLQWTSVGILGSDEWYQVRLWTPDSGVEPLVFRTRATSWRVDTDAYPRSRRDDRFLWDVTVVREIDAAPGIEEQSLTSRQRSFRWR